MVQINYNVTNPLDQQDVIQNREVQNQQYNVTNQWNEIDEQLENLLDYHLNRVMQFEQSSDYMMLNDKEQTQEMIEIYSIVSSRWIPIIAHIELELKSILYNRAYYQTDLYTYITKRLLPFLENLLSKLFTDSRKIKIQCYCNEVLLLSQEIAFTIFPQFPQLSITILRYLFCYPEQKFFDCNFYESQLFPSINQFYQERQQKDIQSQHKGRNTQISQNQNIIYYPLKNELLDLFNYNKSTLQLSPFLRMQINYFFNNGGLSLLFNVIQNFNLNYIEGIDIINYFYSIMDKQLYIDSFHPFKDIIKNYHQKLQEDDVKLYSKEQIKKITETLERALFSFYNLVETKLIILQIELNIYQIFFKLSNLEKRIFGLQQLCEKINSLNYHDFMNIDIQYNNNEQNLQDYLINFLVSNKIFQELFGEKAHFELIKRCSPLIKFLYKHNQLTQNEILQILKMAKGKHESWSNLLFKILNDLVEIMSEADMEIILQEIKEYKIDSNILNFLKCMGKNQNFEKKQPQQKKQPKDNILTELEIEQESPKQHENFTIKVFNEDQQQEENHFIINRINERKPQHQQIQETYKQNHLQDDSIDTNYEEGEGIRGRIVEFLLQQQNNITKDLVNQAFKIALDLICFQFKFLRMKYLNLAFLKLQQINFITNENSTSMSIENHIQLIQRIIQSSYPIDNFNCQNDLVKYLEAKFNFKNLILAVIGKIKQRKYENKLDDYLQLIEIVLKFYQFLYLLTDEKIQVFHLGIIYQLIVQNGFTKDEQDLFYIWVSNQNKIIFTQEALMQIFIEYLIKINYNSYTLAMLNCLQNLIHHFNVQYKIIKNDMDSYIINNSEILGLDILWKIFFESQQIEISEKIQQLLIKIINYKPLNQKVLNQLKLNYIQKIFNNINNKNADKCLNLCVQLLEEVEGNIFKQDSYDQDEIIDYKKNILVIIENKCKNAQIPKKFDMILSEHLQISQIKQLITQKLNPQVNSKEIDIIYRGIWLDNKQLLKDYKIERKSILQIISKSQGNQQSKINKPLIMPEIKQGPFQCKVYPQYLDNSSSQEQNSTVIPIVQSQLEGIPTGQQCINQQTIKLTQEQEIKIQNAMDFSSEYNKDFVEFVLNQNNWNLDQTIIDLIDNKDFYIQQFEENQLIKQIEEPKPIKQQELKEINTQDLSNQKIMNENYRMSNIISDNNIYIEKLFDLLNSDNQIINSKIWQIFSLIPKSQETFNIINECEQTGNWDKIINSQNKHKMYYNLQILKEFLDCDYIDDINEQQRRKILKEKFLLDGGFQKVVQLLNSNLDILAFHLVIEILLIYLQPFYLFKAKYEGQAIMILNLVDTVKNCFKKFEDTQEFKLFQEGYKLQQNNEEEIDDIVIILDLDEGVIPYQKEKQNDDIDQNLLLNKDFKFNEKMKNSFNLNWEQIISLIINKIDYSTEQIFQLILIILQLQPNLLLNMNNNEILIQQSLKILNITSKIEQRQLIIYSLIQIHNYCMSYQKQNQQFGILLFQKLVPLISNNQLKYNEGTILIGILIQLLNQEQIVEMISIFDFSNNIINKLSNSQIIEERFENNEDKIVQGQLILLTSIIEKYPEIKKSISNTLIQSIYSDLFHLNDDYKKYPKFKRYQTRKYAFGFLLELSKKSQQHYLYLLQLLSQAKIKIIFDQDYDQDPGVKGHYGFVGLKNLGATCYINSLIQQLFMNKAFRIAILDCEIAIQDNLNQINIYETVNNINSLQLQRKLNEHTLYQLQQIFIQLQDSVKAFLNPINFISTLSGYDGQPINCSIQSDVNEFFNLLMDKLEQDTKNTKSSNLIHQIMGGTLGHEIRALEQDVEFQSETEEVFLTVSIEIKNKKNLEESLDLFIKADILDGENKYFCESIKRRIDVEKRCYFKQLPNTFIFTLKRFEFDYNRMLKLKVNDYFEFPLEINMFKWTKDHLINNLQLEDYSNYIYKLVGVLVHTGSADSGHYYSFINTKENKWFEFNDKYVTPFKIENLKQECFGGNSQFFNNNIDFLQGFDWDSNKSKNAYLLFYEKIKNDPIQIESKNEISLQNKIIQDNITYLRNQLLNSQEYKNFIIQFTQQYYFVSQNDSLYETGIQVVQLLSLLSFEQINKNNSEFSNTLLLMQTLYDQVKGSYLWMLDYLAKNIPICLNGLIETTNNNNKQSFTLFIQNSILQILKEDKLLINDQQYILNPVIQKFLEVLFLNILFFDSQKTQNKYFQLFNMFKLLLIESQEISEFVQKQTYANKIYKLLKEGTDTNFLRD